MNQKRLTICRTNATQQGQTAGHRTPKDTAAKPQNAPMTKPKAKIQLLHTSLSLSQMPEQEVDWTNQQAGLICKSSETHTPSVFEYE